MRDEGCVTILLFFLPFPFLFGFSPFSWSVFKIRLWNKGERERLLRKRKYHLAVTQKGFQGVWEVSLGTPSGDALDRGWLVVWKSVSTTV